MKRRHNRGYISVTCFLNLLLCLQGTQQPMPILLQHLSPTYCTTYVLHVTAFPSLRPPRLFLDTCTVFIGNSNSEIICSSRVQVERLDQGAAVLARGL